MVRPEYRWISSLALIGALAGYGCGGGLCDVSPADVAGVYEMQLTLGSRPYRGTITFTTDNQTIIEVSEVDEEGEPVLELTCTTPGTSACDLEITCVNERGRPELKFLWTLVE